MAKFSYKQSFSSVEIDITKEMISFKGKTIPAQNVTGIGLGFTEMGKVVAGQVLGGLIGGFIAKKGYEAGNKLNKKISEIPKSRFGHMIITYNEDGNQKVMRIAINTTDENCLKMIETVAKEYHTKFIGFGGLPIVEKTLNIKHTAIIIVTVVIIGLIAAAIIYGSVSSGAY